MSWILLLRVHEGLFEDNHPEGFPSSESHLAHVPDPNQVFIFPDPIYVISHWYIRK